MDKIKKTISRIFDVIEVYIPAVCIFITFVSFICQVFSRRILGHQWAWTFEVCSVSFVLCLFFAASGAARHHTHVTFDSLYDVLPPRMQKVNDIFIALISLFMFGVLLVPCFKTVAFWAIKKTDVLKIPMNILMSTYSIFIVMTLIHTLRDLFVSVRALIKDIKGGKRK